MQLDLAVRLCLCACVAEGYACMRACVRVCMHVCVRANGGGGGGGSGEEGREITMLKSTSMSQVYLFVTQNTFYGFLSSY